MNSNNNLNRIDRRTWLKGAGLSLALPFMELYGWYKFCTGPRIM